MDIIDDAKPLTAPSQGGDLLTWVQAQIGYSEAQRTAAGFASGEAFHRGAVQCLREVLAGLVPLVAERDELRAKVAEFEAAQRWVPVAEQLPSMEEVTARGTSRVLYAPAGSSRCHEANYLYGKGEIGTKHGPRWLLATGGEQWVQKGDHWRWMPAGPEVAL